MLSRTKAAAAPDDGSIDYAAYTELELQEALDGIRGDRYPLNHARLLAEIRRRTGSACAEDLGGTTSAPAPAVPAPVAPAGPYVPNEVSIEGRLKKIGTALALLAYGAYGAWRDDFYVPAKRGNSLHLHGDGALLAFSAVCFAALAITTQVLDHYDRRDNESTYRRVASALNWIALMLFIGAVFRDFRAY
jgi:hypothetical protein